MSCVWCCGPPFRPKNPYSSRIVLIFWETKLFYPNSSSKLTFIIAWEAPICFKAFSLFTTLSYSIFQNLQSPVLNTFTKKPPSPGFLAILGFINGTKEDLKRIIAIGSLIETTPLGNYFTERLDIQPLLPFEGDTIIEGRFGNSIRFGATAIEKEELPEEQSAYSTKGETGDPITIIRNGALVEEEDKKKLK